MLAVASLQEPFVGAHPAVLYSMDLLSPFIYGAHWRYGSWTRPYWIRLPGNGHETSVHLGSSVIALVACAWYARRGIGRRARVEPARVADRGRDLEARDQPHAVAPLGG